MGIKPLLKINRYKGLGYKKRGVNIIFAGLKSSKQTFLHVIR